MITILLTIVHVLVSLFLILIVLAQQGKGQDLASAFGGTGSQTAFGARGTATLLSKITAGSAILFMVTSLSLGYLRPVARTDTVLPDAPAAGTSEPVPDTGQTEPPAAEESVPPADTDTEDDASPKTGTKTKTKTEKPDDPQ